MRSEEAQSPVQDARKVGEPDGDGAIGSVCQLQLRHTRRRPREFRRKRTRGPAAPRREPLGELHGQLERKPLEVWRRAVKHAYASCKCLARRGAPGGGPLPETDRCCDPEMSIAPVPEHEVPSELESATAGYAR